MRITKGDIKWGYISTIMNIGINIIMLPLILKYLSVDELGLWYVFLSIGSIVTLLDFGFTPTLARNVAYSWSGAQELSKVNVIKSGIKEGPNIPLLKKVLMTCKIIYLIIAVLALLLLVIGGTVYINFISKNLTGDYYITAWFIFCIAVFLNLYYGYFTSFLKGVGAMSENSKAVIISKAVQIIVSIILLLFGFGILAVSSAYLISVLIYRIVSKIYFYNYENIGELLKVEEVITSLGEVKETFIIIWHNAWKDGLVSLSNYLMTQANILLSSIYLSLLETGIYALSLQLVTVVASLSVSFYSTYQPLLQKAYLDNDKEKLKRVMSVSIFIFTAMFLICSIGLIVVGIPLINLIKPEAEINISVLLALCIYTFLYHHHSLYASFISNTNQIPYVKAFIISGFSMVGLSFILLKVTLLGIWGLILSQFIVQISYNNWKWPYSVMKSLNTNPFNMMNIGLNEIKSKFQQ